ncbi:hypothetical protein [Gandjariella thermophila]|uniref:Uncharacterized protein n=1 Tax=Gandjariella thermophila TaxID=1931992 RepID=A0A4D4J3F6_9PSEU|nr:hypothetical protein [Gandjariella thermophila]GDY28523.1 hypothetical protein GTS_01560 [Gandjariella thermophila]
MREEDTPSTSVLVDVVTVLGGDVITNSACMAGEPEMVERLVAAAALFDIATRILREVADEAARSGMDVRKFGGIAVDAANSAGVPESLPRIRPFVVE